MSSFHSQRYGSGETVILIHGFCETSEVWNSLIHKLSLNYQVITIDLPGFGKSPLPKLPFSIEDIADQLYSWLIENQLTNSIFIGHSLGGYVLLALVAKHMDIVKGFGLIHSTAFADDEEKKASRNKTIDFVDKRGVKLFAESFVQQLFYVKNRSRLTKEIAAITKTAASTNVKTFTWYMEAMRDRPDLSDVLLTFKSPILFISGDQDTSVPIEKSRAQYSLIANPFIHELKDVGHMGMFEANGETYIAISQYISQFSNFESDRTISGILPERDLKKNLGCG